ncbi:MAG: hypothetical protein MJZ28_00385 [Paludibacteraceae bacterium]|nr:hypothetical protein [Paludibacteraceae bacterium]
MVGNVGGFGVYVCCEEENGGDQLSLLVFLGKMRAMAKDGWNLVLCLLINPIPNLPLKFGMQEYFYVILYDSNKEKGMTMDYGHKQFAVADNTSARHLTFSF